MRKVAGSVFGLTLAALIPFWAVKGTEPAGHAALWLLYGVLLATGVVFVATYAPARYRPSVKVQVRWPSLGDRPLKALKARRKRLTGLLDSPDVAGRPDEAFRHSVEIEEDDFGADLSRYAPQYGSRWHGLPRYPAATPPQTYEAFFRMRLGQAVALLDEIIENMEKGS
jgi:hypothetical protein